MSIVLIALPQFKKKMQVLVYMEIVLASTLEVLGFKCVFFVIMVVN